MALHALVACNLVAGLNQFDHASAADGAGSGPEDDSGPSEPPDASDESSTPDARGGGAKDGPGEIDSGYAPAVRYDFESGGQGWVRNQYNNSQNWGIVSVLQVVDPEQSGDPVEDAGHDGDAGDAARAGDAADAGNPDAATDARAGAAAEAGTDSSAEAAPVPSSDAAAAGADAWAGPDADAGPPPPSLAARYLDGGLNHVLQISYDYSLKDSSSQGSYLEAVNPNFGPTTLGTVHGLTLSLDIYVEHVADLDPTIQVLVQDSSYANCFFAHFTLSGMADRTWATLTATDVGVCDVPGSAAVPQQMCFQFDPHAGAGSIYIDNISW